MHPGERMARDVTAGVSCPTCGAPAGIPCEPEEDGIMPPPHAERMRMFSATAPSGYFANLGRAVMAQATDRELVGQHPGIPWTQAAPITFKRNGVVHGRLACRLCLIRAGGIEEVDLDTLPHNRMEWIAHMREHHHEVLA